MNTFFRNCRKSGINSHMALVPKKYSMTHYRSHFALKYRLNPHGPQFYISRHALLLKHYYLPAINAANSYGYHTLQENERTRRCAMLMSPYNYNVNRYFHVGQSLYEQPSSKVEATVQNMKNKQKEKVEEIIKEAAAAAAAGTTGDNKLVESSQKSLIVKKSLKTRIWEEIVHYYHGFRLLFIDINICRKLLWQVLNGKTLTRRENKLLVRTTSDLFRLIPFSVFVIVPFMELALPLFIKFFPGMLPSTFQTTKDREDKLKQALQVRLEMAKFLQKTLDEMTVQHKEHSSDEAKQFESFFKKIKDPSEQVSNEDIIKFAKRFEDEITLDSLSREQLSALCRVLEINTMGTTNLLKFQLRLKLRSLSADDRAIAREGVNSLDLWELQQACKARGMRAYGLTKERMQTQMQEWIDLSLNEKVPSTLLLLSRAISISDESITTDKLKETLRVLPDSLANQTKAAIGEREGKIDNKVKLEIIREEVRKIQEEREEEKEEAKAKAEKDELLDKAKLIEEVNAELIDRAKGVTNKVPPLERVKPIVSTVLSEAETVKEAETAKAKDEEEKSISSKDVELLSKALKTLSTDRKMVVEKETIKDLKTELEEYKEDVEELREVRQVVMEPVHERRAAKMLFKKVNNMIDQLDKVLMDLEKKQTEVTQALISKELTKEQEETKRRQQDIVRIDELVQTIKKLKQTSDESRLKHIENVLSKLDADKDGVISVDEVLKVVEAIGRENVKLSEKQLEELIILLDKEQIIETEEKIEKAIAKSIKEADEAKKIADQIQAGDTGTGSSGKQQQQEKTANYTEDLKDCAKMVKDNALNLDEIDKKNELKSERIVADNQQETVLLETSKKQKETILPKADISSQISPPPTLPSTTKSNQVNTKDKMI